SFICGLNCKWGLLKLIMKGSYFSISELSCRRLVAQCATRVASTDTSMQNSNG
ncbi:hypothetical protein K1T71_008979, partial [Dendrolimus kikuchii]